jgi:DNA-binding MarR family transcriptional regulator
MNDEKLPIGQNNLRGLIQDLSERSDALALEWREKTAFKGTSPADAKTFMLISRHPRGITALASALGISRQAAHKSVQRLVDNGLVSYGLVKGSRRDMIATLTDKGLDARQVGLQIASQFEKHITDKIGEAQTETLRRLLIQILEPNGGSDR